MSVTMNPQLHAEMHARYRTLTKAAAVAGAEVLEANLSSSTHGTGPIYSRARYPASGEDQFPVKQTGQLVSGVGHHQSEAGAGAQVIVQDDEGKLLGLEFSKPSENPNQPGTPERPSGGRAFMWRTFTDEETIDVMNHAMEFTP